MSKELKELIKTIVESFLLALIIVVIILNFIFMSISVVGSSMEPNLMPDDKGFSFIITKTIGVNRFDIAVIDVDGEDKYLVKRVIGLPNEKVEWIDNKLYINGQYHKETFLDEGVVTADYVIELGDDEYLCVGDNRPISKDSRNYYGPFKKEAILATHIFVIAPFDRIGFKK